MKETIMITGGTGYIGSWIVKMLLGKGYTVRMALRNKSNLAKVQHLLDLEANSSGHLELWEADLLSEGSFDDAAKGCHYIIHSASPFTLHVQDAQKELINPALKGTQNVLRAASKSHTVKKIILTSSVAAIHGDNIDLQEQELSEFSEAQFNTSSTLQHQPYAYSKLLAEKEAWKLAANQSQWQLVVINPAFVMGPPLSLRSNSESLTLMKDILKGKYRAGAPDLMFGFVDVRDVAKAHLSAMESQSAEGRHLLVGSTHTIMELSQLLKSIYGKKYPLPMIKAPKLLIKLLAPAFGLSRQFVQRNVGYPIHFNNTKSRELLHLHYTPFEKTMKDMVDKMERLGMVK